MHNKSETVPSNVLASGAFWDEKKYSTVLLYLLKYVPKILSFHKISTVQVWTY